MINHINAIRGQIQIITSQGAALGIAGKPQDMRILMNGLERQTQQLIIHMRDQQNHHMIDLEPLYKTLSKDELEGISREWLSCLEACRSTARLFGKRARGPKTTHAILCGLLVIGRQEGNQIQHELLGQMLNNHGYTMANRAPLRVLTVICSEEYLDKYGRTLVEVDLERCHEVMLAQPRTAGRSPPSRADALANAVGGLQFGLQHRRSPASQRLLSYSQQWASQDTEQDTPSSYPHS